MAINRVAVIGASGYGGLQSLRLLQSHPNFEITMLGGERSAGKKWSELCPFLPLADNPRIESPDPKKIADRADVALLSLPNGLASGLVPSLLEQSVRVIDLSADYRYRSLEQWSQIYAQIAKT